VYYHGVRTDESLLDAWRDGERDAGDELLRRYFDALYRFFSSKALQDIEDLVQRTLLDCLESRSTLKTGAFRAYLFGVARNRLIDHLRRNARLDASVDVGEISIADLRTSVSQQVARSEQHDLVRQALALVPLDYQIALELAYWENMSGRDIAQVLGIEENTVRSRLARGREMLRDKLATMTSTT
jgi:RNA polymerase sigma factor (sigma-70 family)